MSSTALTPDILWTWVLHCLVAARLNLNYSCLQSIFHLRHTGGAIWMGKSEGETWQNKQWYGECGLSLARQIANGPNTASNAWCIQGFPCDFAEKQQARAVEMPHHGWRWHCSRCKVCSYRFLIQFNLIYHLERVSFVSLQGTLLSKSRTVADHAFRQQSNDTVGRRRESFHET